LSRKTGCGHFLSLLLPPHPSSICERVTPRLSHANSAVVLSAVKVLMKFMEMLSKDLDYYGTLLKKLAPPLVTLLSAEPELQYVALRNINLIVQKRWVPRGGRGASLARAFPLLDGHCFPALRTLWLRRCQGFADAARHMKVYFFSVI